MNKLIIYTIVAAAAFLQACSSQVYNNKSYVKSNDLTGKKIAILPVEVEFTGRLPKGYSLDKKVAEEETEGVTIQNTIYSQYLYHSAKGGSRKSVELINVDQVNSRLKANGIGVRESWSMNPDSLGKLIGADLVLKVRIKKNRIMSESAAFGMDVAGNVLDKILSNKNNSSVVPVVNSKTYNIYVQATLSDAKSHEVVTKFSRQRDADWNRSPETVVKSTGKKIVKKGVVYAQQ
ncbi:hypothetical protein [Hufsiella ginkgonis]|uniref:DUF3313 family protein n=1 Tax=Hufsiella ginkgonis TaxID=2695274 RepID=A0A7K1Y142_9SPHI|nr:hypothetical protein [Hufsiella ginkgonis]MXV16965.1 hypothetical protein [Hufsiella ginkgonis]